MSSNIPAWGIVLIVLSVAIGISALGIAVYLYVNRSTTDTNKVNSLIAENDIVKTNKAKLGANPSVNSVVTNIPPEFQVTNKTLPFADATHQTVLDLSTFQLYDFDGKEYTLLALHVDSNVPILVQTEGLFYSQEEYQKTQLPMNVKIKTGTSLAYNNGEELNLAQNGATAADQLRWNGSEWVPQQSQSIIFNDISLLTITGPITFEIGNVILQWSGIYHICIELSSADESLSSCTFKIEIESKNIITRQFPDVPLAATAFLFQTPDLKYTEMVKARFLLEVPNSSKMILTTLEIIG